MSARLSTLRALAALSAILAPAVGAASEPAGASIAPIPPLPPGAAAQIAPEVPAPPQPPIPQTDSLPSIGLPPLDPAPLRAGDRPLPINLATSLRLADARPLVIQAAEASVQIAAAQYAQARVLWLPNFYTGASYYFHNGGTQQASGTLYVNTRQNFLAGGGIQAFFATTDAIFTPLAARQVLEANRLRVQAARNDAMLSVAEAFFNVQQARGRLAGQIDAAARGADLWRRVQGVSIGLTSPIEVDRVLTHLADIDQNKARAREEWRVASAALSRILRLDPTAVVEPMEPPNLQLTLFAPDAPVDDLVPVGLTNRPELASQQALVRAALVRIRQERLRPLIPSIALNGLAPGTSGGFLNGGVYASSLRAEGRPTTGTFDLNPQLLWELRNLGAGNVALVRERQAQYQYNLVELFQAQDRVAAEVAESHAQLESAAIRVNEATTGLNEAIITYDGNVKGLGQTTRFGDVLHLLIRPQEAVTALQMLSRSYDNYFQAIHDYNRAQFRLYHAMGFPAQGLACQNPPGPIVPVNLARPQPGLPPVTARPPCSCPTPPGTAVHAHHAGCPHARPR